MEPPPPPSSGRFRLRVQIYPPQDVHNLTAAPLRQFTIVKTPVLPLPDLTLRQLCEEVVKRFQAIYPSEALFSIERSQDSYGSDLYLGDRVQDIFEDNEIFRVIKGTSIRASVEPHRARSRSEQPTSLMANAATSGRKRKPEDVRAEDLLPAEKRQRISVANPDHPMLSREHASDEGLYQQSEDYLPETTVIMNSQESTSRREPRKASDMRGQPQGQPSVSGSGPRDGFEAHEIRSTITPKSVSTKVSAASVQRVNSPPSVGSSKDDAWTSGSDAQLPNFRNMTSSRRKIHWIEEPSDQERGRSTSTAITTPPSFVQLSNTNSPSIDNKKLKRPLRMTKADGYKAFKSVPRGSPYDDFKTDDEAPSTRLPTRSLSLKGGNITAPVGVSLHKFLSKSPNLPDNGGSKKSPVPQGIVAPKAQVSGPRDTGKAVVAPDTKQVETESVKFSTLQRQRIQEQQNRARLVAQAAERRHRISEKEEKQRQDKLAQEIQAKKVEVEARRATNASPGLNIETESIADSEFETLETDEQGQNADTVPAESSRQEHVQVDIGLEGKPTDSKLSNGGPANMTTVEGKKSKQHEEASFKTPVRVSSAKISSDSLPGTNSQPPAQENKEAVSKTALGAVNALPGVKRTSCTPFIPRGRPIGLGSSALLSSQVIASSSPRTSPANVGLEAQMPLPPQLRRKVSFADHPLSSRHRSSSASTSASSNLRQTTLVPPRLGITDVKSTSQRKPLRGTPSSSASSKPSKGKAKVVESPGQRPAAPIVISSSKESSQDLSDFESWAGDSNKVGQPGPAYRKSQLRASVSPKIPEPATDKPNEIEMAERQTGVAELCTENAKQPSSPAEHHSTTSPASPGETKSRLQVLVRSAPAVGLSVLADDRAQNVKSPESNAAASTLSHDPSQEGDDSELSDVEEVLSAIPNPTTPDSKQRADKERTSSDTQAQVDNQLTQSIRSSSPSKPRTSPTPRKSPPPSDANAPPSSLSSADVQQRQILSQQMPSLRRMNLEAQRTKEAAHEAAKARGLAKAQQLRDEARRTDPRAASSSSESSSSPSSSSESDSDDDDDDEALPPPQRRLHTGELDSEDLEDIRQELFAQMGGLDHKPPPKKKAPASSPPRAVNATMTTGSSSPRKQKTGERGLETTLGREKGEEKEKEKGKEKGKKSSKLGLAKLARKYAPGKQKTVGGVRR